MKKIISIMVVTVVIMSSTAAFADGGRRGGISTGSAIAIGLGALFLGTVIGEQNARQNMPVQYVPVAPMQMQYAPVQYQQVQVIPPSFVRGTCFMQGAYFPDGVTIIGLGYYPPGTQVPPGFCF